MCGVMRMYTTNLKLEAKQDLHKVVSGAGFANSKPRCIDFIHRQCYLLYACISGSANAIL